MPNNSSFLRPQIALPQDHGSWVFILSPLAIGVFAGGKMNNATLAFVLAAMMAFMIRQPTTIAIKALYGRRPRSDLPASYFWSVIYGAAILFASLALFILRKSFVFYLSIPALPVFAWHLWLVSRREERRQMGIEMLATGVFALAAPAAFWLGKDNYNSSAWAMWLLVWFQSAASILYAYLRLEQRQWKNIPTLEERLKPGFRAIIYTVFNLILSIILGTLRIVPTWVFLAHLVQTAETLWGTFNPAVGAKPVAIGMRQLIVSILFTIIFIITWR